MLSLFRQALFNSMFFLHQVSRHRSELGQLTKVITRTYHPVNRLGGGAGGMMHSKYFDLCTCFVVHFKLQRTLLLVYFIVKFVPLGT